MIRKLFFLLVLLFINSSCSMATLDAKSLKEGTQDSEVLGKEISDLRRERHQEMILARLDRMGKRQ